MAGRAVIGILCVAVGIVWILQGIGVLGGSFMSGAPIWAVIGLLLTALGAGLLNGARKYRRRAD